MPKSLDSEVANTRWKAVETFCNMLSELRAYGEGFVIVEQIPTKLAEDAIKNTNLKIVHRLVSADDRELIGSTMNIREQELRRIAAFKRGEAAVYSEGDDRPIQVNVPKSKVQLPSEINENVAIQGTMNKVSENMLDVFAPFDNCILYCNSICSYKNIGKRIIEHSQLNEIFSRYVISIVENELSLGNDFIAIDELIRFAVNDSNLEFGKVLCTLIQISNNYFETKGRQYGWRYNDVHDLKNSFMYILYEFIEVFYSDPTESDIQNFIQRIKPDIVKFQQNYRQLCDVVQPYTHCSEICENGLCVYRHNILDLFNDKYLDDTFRAHLNKYKGPTLYQKLYQNAELVTGRIVSPYAGDLASERVSLCYVLHRIKSLPRMDNLSKDNLTKSVISEVKASKFYGESADDA